jgi:hypothetical protein
VVAADGLVFAWTRVGDPSEVLTASLEKDEIPAS